MSDNIYQPEMAKVLEVQQEAGGGRPIKTFKVQIEKEEERFKFEHKPGQFLIASMLGTGESVFAINSAPSKEGIMTFSVMKVGNVTAKLHELEPGDRVGIRGPYGNFFPVKEWEGKDIVFIGAGIGISPVASVYRYVLAPENRDKYGKIQVIYGARTPNDFAFKAEFEDLETREDVDLWRCIDWKFGPNGPIPESSAEGWPAINMSSPGETPVPDGVKKYTCFVPQLVEVSKPPSDNAITVTCGPPIAIKFITQALEKLGWNGDQIYTTLENRMKCGVGKCGRCNIGHIYVCKQGPVFSNTEIQKMMNEF